MQKRTSWQRCWGVIVGLLLLFPLRAAPEEIHIDFTQPTQLRGWHPDHDIRLFERTPEGLRIVISGEDPYFSGPPLAFPTNQLLWLVLEIRSRKAGMGQVFYFRDHARERQSVRFPVRGGFHWQKIHIPLPALPRGTRLRIDPPGRTGNEVIIRSLEIRPRVPIPQPQWRKPTPVQVDPKLRLDSGPLTLLHTSDQLGGFVLKVHGKPFAQGHNHPLLGYMKDGHVRWIDWNATATVQVHSLKPYALADRAWNAALVVESYAQDPDGGRWWIEQRFEPSTTGVIQVTTTVRCNADRQVVYLPLLMVLVQPPGWGTNKTQALFAGLEYLANEPSSSQADVETPAAHRQVPEQYKITFPLMTICADHRWLALSWQMKPEVAAVFDSPDRFFHSGGHLMGLILPGSDGTNREPNQLVPWYPMWLPADRPFRLTALILAGQGDTVVPSIQTYVRLNGLPELPPRPYTPTGYYRLAAHGWLHSKIREGVLYRHAWWPHFGPQPAADAAWTMDWLSEHVGDPSLATELQNAAQQALQRVPPGQRLSHQIGHNRWPVPILCYDAEAAELQSLRAMAQAALKRFGPDGLVHFRPRPGKPNYARTHWTDHANGLTATVVRQLLEAAVWTGDARLQQEAVAALDRITAAYRNSVPRGAQTWEVPLHTPDILASAHLVECYVLGYQLTGRPDLLEQARYWAWTGVPFVYLRQPVEGSIGLYCTIPVYGATSWKAPVWFGLPVQWCGLVYAQALYQLAAVDSTGPWKKLADGITVAGMQVTWPEEDPDRKGLLPDVFFLRTQQRAGPAINPATLLLPAIQFFRETPPYQSRVFRRVRLCVLAPGQIESVQEQQNRLRFQVRPGWQRPMDLVITGFRSEPRITVTALEGGPVQTPHYERKLGAVWLRFQGRIQVEIQLPGR